MALSHEHAGSKILAKSKSIASPEQNYFSFFAMRCPVHHIVFHLHHFKFMLQLVNHLELIGTLSYKVSTDAGRSGRIFDNCFDEDIIVH